MVWNVSRKKCLLSPVTDLSRGQRSSFLRSYSGSRGWSKVCVKHVYKEINLVGASNSAGLRHASLNHTAGISHGSPSFIAESKVSYVSFAAYHALLVQGHRPCFARWNVSPVCRDFAVNPIVHRSMLSYLDAAYGIIKRNDVGGT